MVPIASTKVTGWHVWWNVELISNSNSFDFYYTSNLQHARFQYYAVCI